MLSTRLLSPPPSYSSSRSSSPSSASSSSQSFSSSYTTPVKNLGDKDTIHLSSLDLRLQRGTLSTEGEVIVSLEENDWYDQVTFQHDRDSDVGYRSTCSPEPEDIPWDYREVASYHLPPVTEPKACPFAPNSTSTPTKSTFVHPLLLHAAQDDPTPETPPSKASQSVDRLFGVVCGEHVKDLVRRETKWNFSWSPSSFGKRENEKGWWELCESAVWGHVVSVDPEGGAVCMGKERDEVTEVGSAVAVDEEKLEETEESVILIVDDVDCRTERGWKRKERSERAKREERSRKEKVSKKSLLNTPSRDGRSRRVKEMKKRRVQFA
ncbi:hypothetical protein BT69DRAFT_1299969 [Atractiella rhizophila]|nr:hypothetical protein BT69DRAFT_1299969 [Atractiella rhizophila]